MTQVDSNNSSINLANLTQAERDVLYQNFQENIPDILRIQIIIDTSIARLFQSFGYSQPSSHIILGRAKLRSLKNEYFLKIIQLGMPKTFDGQDLNLCMNSALLKGALAIEPFLSVSAWEYVGSRLFTLFGSISQSGNYRLINELLDHPEVKNAYQRLSPEEQLNWQRVKTLYSAGVAVNSIWSKCMNLTAINEPNPLLLLESIHSSGKLFLRSLENLNTHFEAQLVVCKQVLNDLKVLNNIDYQKKAIKSLETSIETVQTTLTSFRRVIKSRLRLFKRRLEIIPIVESYTENPIYLRKTLCELSQIRQLFSKQLTNLFNALKNSYKVFYRGLPQTVRNKHPELKPDLPDSSQDYFTQYTEEEKKASAYQAAYISLETGIDRLSSTLLEIDEDNISGACLLAYLLNHAYSSVELNAHLAFDNVNLTGLRQLLQLLKQPPSQAILELSHLNELMLSTSVSKYLKPMFDNLVQLLKNYDQLHKETFFSVCFISQLQINTDCLLSEFDQFFKEHGENPKLNLDWLLEEDPEIVSETVSPPQAPRKRIQQNSNAENKKLQARETVKKKIQSRGKKNSSPIRESESPRITSLQKYHLASKDMLQGWKKGHSEVNNYIYKDCLRHFRLLGATRDAMLLTGRSEAIQFTLMRSASLALEKVLKLTSYGSDNPKVFGSHDHKLLLENSPFSKEKGDQVQAAVEKVRLGAAFVRYPHFYQNLFLSHHERIPEGLEWILKESSGNMDELLSWEEQMMKTAHIALNAQKELPHTAYKIEKTCNSLSKTSQNKLDHLSKSLSSVINVVNALKTEDLEEVIVQKDLLFHLKNLATVLHGWKADQDSRLLWVYGEAILTHLQVLDELIETLLHYKNEGILLRPQHDLAEWRELLNQEMNDDEQIICSELNIDRGAHYVHQWLHGYKGKREDLPMAIVWRLDAERLCRYSEEYAEGFLPTDGKLIPDPMDLSERLLKLVEVVLRSAQKRLT